MPTTVEDDLTSQKKSMHEPRLERGPPVWETGILPLNYPCVFTSPQNPWRHFSRNVAKNDELKYL